MGCMRFSTVSNFDLEQIVCQCGEFAWGCGDEFDCSCGQKYMSLEHWMKEGRLDLYAKGVKDAEELEKRLQVWTEHRMTVDKQFCQFCKNCDKCIMLNPVRKWSQGFTFDGDRYMSMGCKFVLAQSCREWFVMFLRFYRAWNGPVNIVEEAIEAMEAKTCRRGDNGWDTYEKGPKRSWEKALREVTGMKSLKFNGARIKEGIFIEGNLVEVESVWELLNKFGDLQFEWRNER